MQSPTPSTPRSALAGAGAFAWRHRVGLGRLTGILLIAVVILQNVEPTSIDLLFWSVASVPKLVLLLAAMLVGALVWEMLRHVLLPRRS